MVSRGEQNQTAKDRRQKLAELRRQQQAAERRRTILLVSLSVLIGLGLIGAAAAPIAIKWYNDPARKPVSAFGVSASAAACDPVITDPATGNGDHVGPGSQKPDVTTVRYATVPPTSGQHWAFPAPFERKFYTAQDRPRMEELVHNLEHGYTVVWYDDTIKGAELQALKDLAGKIPKDPRTSKFIVSAWDPAYGEFPAGKHVAMSRWTSKNGVRQLCGKVSGEAIAEFMKKYPQADAPEPNGA
ncbi:putative membrane protein [Carbonactinospora thermoautotrophica]|uniref:Putative membrane protein n=1 Tax=Carbonactinospora thermoautotrophica TaxID=1469144 RepID=A0A132MYB2_9ACTN|nr:DUF3105 domain-containing protein [Carbonactinospora thermoautotrophica]KWX02352.1 putative membrane protein [Carbonactinospora thermoautotrophica]